MPRSRLILASSCLAALFSFARVCSAWFGRGDGRFVFHGRLDGYGRFVFFDGRLDWHGRFVLHGRQHGHGRFADDRHRRHAALAARPARAARLPPAVRPARAARPPRAARRARAARPPRAARPGRAVRRTGGNPGTGGTMVDQGGMALAKPGATTSTSNAYFNLGDMRLINNRWGSDRSQLQGATQSVFINSDKTIGWSFNRGNCGEQNHGQSGLPRGGVRRRAVRKDELAADVAGVLVDDAAADPASKLNSASVTHGQLLDDLLEPDLLGRQLRVLDQQERSDHEQRRRCLRGDHHLHGLEQPPGRPAATTSWACQITGQDRPQHQLLALPPERHLGQRVALLQLPRRQRAAATTPARSTSRPSSTTSGASTAGSRTACT